MITNIVMMLEPGGYDTFGDVLEDEPRRGLYLLDDPDVEVDSVTETIKVPQQEYPGSRSLKAISEKAVSEAHSWVAERAPENPVYKFGRKSAEGVWENNPDSDPSSRAEETATEARWHHDDNHRKSAYGTGFAALGSASWLAGGEELNALGLAGAGVILGAANSYARGARDAEIEQAVGGLQEAYGDYEIELD